LESTTKENHYNATAAVETFDEHVHAFCFGESLFAGLYLVVCGLMATGAACRKRSCMVPYLVVQLLVVLVFLVSAGAAVAILFVADTLSGCVALGVALVFGFLIVYFYGVVSKTLRAKFHM